jgi:AcrR family transcriptional regulator
MASSPQIEPVSRAQRSRQISTRILETSLELLATEGIDGLTMQRVAIAAELSNGPLYGRYDTPEDIVLDLWDTVLRQHLGTILDDLSAWFLGEGAPVPDRLAQELARPSVESRALIETLAAVRRYPYAAETIRPELSEDLETFAGRQPMTPRSLVAGQLALVFGTLLLEPMFQDEQERMSRSLLSILEGIMSDTLAWSAPKRDLPPLSAPLPVPATGDEVVDAFVSAVILVVAQTGYDRATTHRIARAAKHSYSSAYSHFASKDDLMAYAMKAMIDEIFAFGLLGMMELNPDERIDVAVSMARGISDDEHRFWRQLRVETAVAARHHAELAEALRANFEHNRARAIEVLASSRIDADPEFEARLVEGWHLVRTLGFGLALLASASGFTHDIEWTPGITALLGHLEGVAFREPGL